jgi:hypothetical protein
VSRREKAEVELTLSLLPRATPVAGTNFQLEKEIPKLQMAFQPAQEYSLSAAPAETQEE